MATLKYMLAFALLWTVLVAISSSHGASVISTPSSSISVNKSAILVGTNGTNLTLHQQQVGFYNNDVDPGPDHVVDGVKEIWGMSMVVFVLVVILMIVLFLSPCIIIAIVLCCCGWCTAVAVSDATSNGHGRRSSRRR